MHAVPFAMNEDLIVLLFFSFAVMASVLYIWCCGWIFGGPVGVVDMDVFQLGTTLFQRGTLSQEERLSSAYNLWVLNHSCGIIGSWKNK